MSKTSLNWRFVPVTKVDVNGWNAILDKLKEVWGPPTPPRAGCAFRTTWYDTTWWVGDDNVLNYVDPETFELKRVRCTDNPTGQNSRDYWVMLRKQIEETFGATMNQIWGYFGWEFYGLRACVTPQLCWCAPRYTNRVLHHVYKADISSAFPYEACKRLPTLVGSKDVFERPEPDETYPFVFGSDGSLVFLEEDGSIIDTASINSSRYRGNMDKIIKNQFDVAKENHYPKLPHGRPFWIKCPAGPSLEAVMEPLYKAKQAGDLIAKSIMNQFIGYTWLRKQPQFLHLAAVILARCNNRIIKQAECLIDRGAIPVLIATDSIAWIGKGDELITTDKAHKTLGSFVVEMRDGEAIIAGPKVYQLRAKDGHTTTTWSGVPQEESKNMVFGQVMGRHEIIHIRDPETYKWVPQEDIYNHAFWF